VGFEILRTYEETEEEHHLWILAEKKAKLVFYR